MDVEWTYEVGKNDTIVSSNARREFRPLSMEQTYSCLKRADDSSSNRVVPQKHITSFCPCKTEDMGFFYFYEHLVPVF